MLDILLALEDRAERLLRSQFSPHRLHEPQVRQELCNVLMAELAMLLAVQPHRMGEPFAARDKRLHAARLALWREFTLRLDRMINVAIEKAKTGSGAIESEARQMQDITDLLCNYLNQLFLRGEFDPLELDDPQKRKDLDVHLDGHLAEILLHIKPYQGLAEDDAERQRTWEFQKNAFQPRKERMIELARKRARESKVITELATGPAKTPEDGPRPPDLFYWKGNAEHLPTLVWRMLDILWGKDSIPEDEVAEHVWGKGVDATDSQLKSTLHDLNTVLLKMDLPWGYGRLKGYFVKK